MYLICPCIFTWDEKQGSIFSKRYFFENKQKITIISICKCKFQLKFSFPNYHLQGVNYLHEHSIIHRNIQPQYILLTESAEVRICGMLLENFLKYFITLFWFDDLRMLLIYYFVDCFVDINTTALFWNFISVTYLHPIQGGGGKKGPSLYKLFLCNFYKRSNEQWTFWLLILTLFPHWCKISRLWLVPVPNYWTWTNSTSQKNWFFWSNPYKIENLITSFIEILELPNFGDMTTCTI